MTQVTTVKLNGTREDLTVECIMLQEIHDLKLKMRGKQPKQEINIEDVPF